MAQTSIKGSATVKGSTAKAAKGAYGHALGVTFIKYAEDMADKAAKESMSYKDRLKELAKGTREDHIEFRVVLEERLSAMKDVAATLGFSFTAYREMDPKAAVISTQCSMWAKLSKALEANYKPDYDQSWAYISQKATEHNDARGTPSADTKNPQNVSPAKKKGRKELPLWDKVRALVDGRPLQEIEAVHASLGQYIEGLKKVKRGGRDVVASTSPVGTPGANMPMPTAEQIKAAKQPRGGGVPAPRTGGTFGDKVSAQQEEKAVAKGN